MKVKQKQNSNPLLHFFAIYGLDINSSINIHDNHAPKVLSSLSIQGETKEYETLIETLSNDPYLPDYIFPSKVNSLFNIDFSQFEADQPIPNELLCNSYQANYIKYFYEEPFFHCFDFQHCDQNNNYLWYFSCLIFLEKIKRESTHFYAAKAMLIVTKEPFFILCKDILLNIYTRSKDLTPNLHFPFPPIPLEPFIIQLFSQLRSEDSSMLNLDINSQIKYKTSMESFLSLCDLNYALFFEMFTIKEVLFLIEQFLQRKTIIIASTSIEYLYPLYHILLTLIHPLDILDNTFCYRLFTIKYIPILFSQMPCFVFIYLDKMLDETFFKNLAQKKESDMTVVNITPCQSSMTQNQPFIIKNQYYKYKSNGVVDVWKFDTVSLIEKAVSKLLDEETHYFPLLANEVDGILKETKSKDRSNFFSSTGKNYEDLRRLFFGLITRFFVIMVPQVEVTYDDDSITFNLVQIDDDDDDDNGNQKSKDHMIKEFYNNFSSSPSFDIIFKNDKNINNPNLKNLILLDELLKITKLDKNRLYYDFNTNSSNKASLTELKVDTFKVYKSNKLFYMNKYNKILNRNESNPTFHLESNTSTSKCFIYDQLVLYFGEFKDEINKALLSSDSNQGIGMKAEKKADIILFEIDCLYNLLITNTIPFLSSEEYSSGLAGLMLSFMILNDESMKVYFKKLIELFHRTKGFYQKFNVNLSLIYEILILHQELKEEYFELFMGEMKALDLIPTYNIYLKYNNKAKSKITPIPGLYLNTKTIYVEAVKVIGCEVHGDIHHLDQDYYCSGCKMPLFIKFRRNEEKERKILFYHPRIMLEELLMTMLAKQNVVVNIEYFNEDFYDNIGRIGYLMQAYYDFNLFNINNII